MICRGKPCCSGNPSGSTRGIPSCGDARRSVETVRTGSVLRTSARGITGNRPQIMRQSGLHSMAKVQSHQETRWPSGDVRISRSVTECFLYGALIASAPMYSGVLQGLQISDVTPYS